MAERDPLEIINEAGLQINREGSFATWLQNSVLGGIILGVTIQIIEIVQTGGSTLLAPVRAIGMGLADLFGTIVGGPVALIDASIQTGVRSFQEGTAAILGPAAFPFAIFVVMAGLWVFGEAIQRVDLSPWNYLTERFR
jgi:hypothetical protein